MPLVCCEGSWSCSAAALASAKTDRREDVNSVLDFCAEELRTTDGPPPIMLLRVHISKASKDTGWPESYEVDKIILVMMA